MNKLIKDTLSITVNKDGQAIAPNELASVLVQYNGMIKYVLKELAGLDVEVAMNEYDNKTGKIVFGVKKLEDNVTDAKVIQ